MTSAGGLKCPQTVTSLTVGDVFFLVAKGRTNRWPLQVAAACRAPIGAGLLEHVISGSVCHKSAARLHRPTWKAVDLAQPIEPGTWFCSAPGVEQG